MSVRGFLATLTVVLVSLGAPGDAARAQGGLGGAIGGTDPAPEPVPVPGDRNNTLTGALDGATVSQPVADPVADVQVHVLAQSDDVMIDVPFRFSLRVVGDPVRAANNARVRIGATLRRADGSQAPAGEVAFTRAIVPQPAGQPQRECVGKQSEQNDRICLLGDLPPGGEARIFGELRTMPTAQPGELVLIVQTRFGNTELRPVETIVKLVPKRQLSNVGLTLDISSDTDVAAMGLDFVHTIRVRNSSATEDATRSTLEIRQRAVAQRDAGFTALAADGMTVSVGDPRCTLANETYRCNIGTLRAGQETRVPVRVAIVNDLPAQRSGKVETQARVKSAEVDPEPDDNFDKETTTLVSRQPEIAFLTPVGGQLGQTRFVEGDVLANGRLFGIGARFMHPLVEPSSDQIVVRVAVNAGQSIDVSLRKPLVGQAPIYRSGALRLLPPGARADAGEQAINATNGDELSAVYQRSSARARVLGTK